MSVKFSPLIRWSNSILSMYVQDENLDEICIYGEWLPPFDDPSEKKFQRYVDRLLRRFVVELIKRYDPSINRHTLKDLKVINLIAEPITFIELGRIGDNMRFKICGKQKLVDLDKYEQKSEA